MEQIINPAFCEWDTARFLIFSGNVFGDYIYYSHLFPAVAALLLGFFVWIRSPKSLLHITLLVITLSFSLWVFFDLVLWATEKTNYTMFFWSAMIHFDLLIYASALYFTYLFIDKKDIPASTKVLILLPFLPLFLLAHTPYNLVGFDFSNCDREALEGPLWQYTYIVEIFFVLWIAVLGMERFRTNKESRREIALAVIGILAFLLAFSWGNIVGSLAVDWDLGQYGLFGMPVFLAFLAYLIVRFRSFGIQLISAQVLVAASTLLVLALLLVRTIENVRIIAVITATLILIVGIMLVRSVQQEIRQRERIEKLAAELEKINKQQEGLIHFVSHEVKGYLTKSAGVFSGIIEGDYGKSNITMETVAKNALLETRKGIDEVINILKASNLKKGTVTYKMEPFDFAALLKTKCIDLETFAETKGLTFSLSITEGVDFTIKGDAEHLGGHVIRNIIENAINYTPTGNVSVELKKVGNKAVLTVQDTGVGITEEDKQKLFTEGGHGKDSIKVNVHSTGYGLYIAKNIVEAHGGTISAHSEGSGKGSTFVIELPM